MSPKIYEPVRHALQGMVNGFLEGSKAEGEIINKAIHQPFLGEIVTAFSQINDFEAKLRDMDIVFERYETFKPVQEFCFDLLMVNFFAADSIHLGEEYLQSQEWSDIEDRVLDRGTEFLNLLLYINEAKESGAKITLDDFLKEFLLTEDDLYQDEYFIYEPIIKNQQLVDGEIKDIVDTAKNIDDEDLQEIYVPLMVFFNKQGNFDSRLKELLAQSTNKRTEAALLVAIQDFFNSVVEAENGE